MDFASRWLGRFSKLSLPLPQQKHQTMKTSKKQVLDEVKRYVIITFALFTMCLGWTAILTPS